ncbi:DUF3379 domain-containing protein [Shewanella corallii]|uniref:DUF3379 domain-containing protein n=1 Tax=Shewanella corallii TaxID=560080 RepID=A0ABT0NC21_9GAMM|nr:DUF3379 family protein [Shewanella corallii]MCL2915352.1 DUF3379 domain-containing protein [Shewanella corallii]
MDELEFRRRAYADPQSRDDDFIQASEETPERQQFLKDLNKLDAKLEQAMSLDVPDDLADKLLLNQQLSNHRQQKKTVSFMMAMAASVAMVLGVGYATWRMAPIELSEHAIAHVLHEPKALSAHGDISFNQINAQLASLKGFNDKGFSSQPGQIFYSTYCDFQGVRSLHLVMQGENGKVTLFIVPTEERMALESQFADNHFKGLGFSKGDAFLLLVGENQQDLQFARQELDQSFI